MPSFDETAGAVLAETSRGLFIGAGLIGALIALRFARERVGMVMALRLRR